LSLVRGRDHVELVKVIVVGHEADLVEELDSLDEHVEHGEGADQNAYGSDVLRLLRHVTSLLHFSSLGVQTDLAGEDGRDKTQGKAATDQREERKKQITFNTTRSWTHRRDEKMLSIGQSRGYVYHGCLGNDYPLPFESVVRRGWRQICETFFRFLFLLVTWVGRRRIHLRLLVFRFGLSLRNSVFSSSVC